MTAPASDPDVPSQPTTCHGRKVIGQRKASLPQSNSEAASHVLALTLETLPDDPPGAGPIEVHCCDECGFIGKDGSTTAVAVHWTRAHSGRNWKTGGPRGPRQQTLEPMGVAGDIYDMTLREVIALVDQIGEWERSTAVLQQVRDSWRERALTAEKKFAQLKRALSKVNLED